ncbi:MAG: cystathionine beta-lyase [Hyphomicrobiales bacterium]|nr:cystathionine beta-lyase [Hyphomicrobiales bacterium]
MKKDTRLTHAGNDPANNHGVVNPPVYHASTIASATLDERDWRGANRFQEGVYAYGLGGTPTQGAFEKAVSELEGGERTVALPSGLAAVTVAILAFVKTGDHVLMVDTVYEPSRTFCDRVLANFGVDVTYYDPMVGAGIAELMRPQTKVVFCESPGSLTFEVQDMPAIIAAAHAGGARVVIDNSWSAGYYYRPLDQGADLTVQAATKYIGGHSDVMLGTITMAGDLYRQVKSTASVYGFHAAPDDCYLGLRGLRSLSARLPRHRDSALAMARWLETRPEVAAVYHPALPSCPGHEFWKRDFTGSTGLFGLLLKDGYSDAAVAALVDGLDLFTIGASWGGYESLILRQHPERCRTATPWTTPGALLRLHIGLEDPDDLKADLEAGFDRLNAAA